MDYRPPRWRSNSATSAINDWDKNLRKYSRIANTIRTWVFIDEHEKSIDDGIFGIGLPGVPGVDGDFWIAYPGDRHNNGANLSFADGHVESHRWRAHRTITVYTAGKTFIRKDDDANLDDLHWLQERLPNQP